MLATCTSGLHTDAVKGDKKFNSSHSLNNYSNPLDFAPVKDKNADKWEFAWGMSAYSRWR